MLVAAILRQVIRIGTLTLIDSKGRTHRIEGEREGPAYTIRFRTARMERRFMLNASLALGEGYMNGWWNLEGDADLYEFLEYIGWNLELTGRPRYQEALRSVLYPFRRWLQYNPLGLARKNVSHHYDLSRELYELFLDGDRQYSCAYYRNPDPDSGDSLETAQFNKKRHIAAKLLLEPGQKVLDIGCGWGGLALFLAREFDVEVTGLTLSTEQHALAERRASEEGLSDKVTFHLRDYREETGTYDRIVSVGMFEHVGVGHYDAFFRKVEELLGDNGVALLHTIGRMEGPGMTDPWIRKYIFPGGYIPALSEVAGSVERTLLWMTDIEVLRLHYAYTLRDWRKRFLANRDKAEALYDDRFCRMWEYYLAVCEMSFRSLRNAVFQVQLAKRQENVPLTREYLWDWPYEGAEGQAAIKQGDSRAA